MKKAKNVESFLPQPRSQGSLLPARAGRKEPWERGCSTPYPTGYSNLVPGASLRQWEGRYYSDMGIAAFWAFPKPQ